jgi:hypothetical protein
MDQRKNKRDDDEYNRQRQHKAADNKREHKK